MARRLRRRFISEDVPAMSILYPDKEAIKSYTKNLVTIKQEQQQQQQLKTH